MDVFHLGATSRPRDFGLDSRDNEQLKIAEPVQNECEVSLAMTTILIAQSRNQGRQHKKEVIARRHDAAIFLLSARVLLVAPF